MTGEVRRESCKTVTTHDATGHPNGFLVELKKEGKMTTAYLTATHPKAFKGYHLHTVRQSHYVCIKGTMKITVVEGVSKVEHILDGGRPERLSLPTNVWIGLENIGEEEAWLLNFPDPPYDPDTPGEQLEKTALEIEEQLQRLRLP